MSFVANFTPQWIEAQYHLWRADPEQVSADWHAFFTGFEVGGGALPGKEAVEPELALKQSAVQSLIYRYRDIGHLLACTDPLSPCKIDHPLLNLAAFDLEPSDLDRTFYVKRFKRSPNLDDMADQAGAPGAELHAATLRQILEVMRETYCRDYKCALISAQERTFCVRARLVSQGNPKEISDV